jgi:hypothetical protein
MRPGSPWIYGATSAVVLAIAVRAQARGAREAPSPPSPPCVAVSGESRYGGVGWTHVVQLRNGCVRPAECVVSTDLTPLPASVAVPALSAVDYVAYLDSPAFGFGAHVTCTVR